MGKKGSKKAKSAQKNYVVTNKRDRNKLRRAQKLANKFGHPVKIKYQGKIEIIKSQG